MERSLTAHRLLSKNTADLQHLRVLIKLVCLHQGTHLTLGLAQMDHILLMMNATVVHVIYGYRLLMWLLLDMTLWRKEKSRSRRRDRRSRRRTHRVMQGVSPLVVVLMPGVVYGANATWTIQKL